MKVSMSSYGEGGAMRRGYCPRRGLFFLFAAAFTVFALLYWHRPIVEDIVDTKNLDTFSTVSLNASQFYTKKHLALWTWTCRSGRCERLLACEATPLQSLQTCNNLCASPQLWPLPTGHVSLAKTAVSVRANQYSLKIAFSPSVSVSDHLNEAFALFKDDLRNLEHSHEYNRHVDFGTPRDVIVHVSVNGSADPRLRLNTDESYKLNMRPNGNIILVDISAQSFCGARHGFETLSQLIWLDPYADSLLTLEAANVEDEPRFHYRGLLLDTARNYFPVKDIIRTIDAMAACKLNTFHWHAVDSQSFPLKLNSAPQLAKHGAYGSDAIYTTDDIKAIVHRAKLRGIRVLIEVDAPGHVGRAWGWGPEADLGHLAYCIEEVPWNAYCGEPPCGQLNAQNPHVYDILTKIYAEIIELTGVDDVFHIGGDEVSKGCWNKYIKNTNPMDLWLNFTRQTMDSLQRANGGHLPELTLLWSSHLTQSPYLEKLDKEKISIQIWGSSKWPESRAVLDSGFRSIMSHVNAWYLDCGVGSWRDSSAGHCPPYRSWQLVYEHRPWIEEKPAKLSSANVNSWRIDGGEACLWTELLGPGGLDARLWPRAAALAERLWSDRSEGAAADVYLRLDTQRARLVAKGVYAEPLWPHWCSQNPNVCL